MLIPIDEVVYFDCITNNPSTGAVSDADSTPTFEVFEEGTDTDIGVGGNLTKRTSKTGNYRGSFTASAANGFEAGKWYSVIASATVNSVAGKDRVLHFRCAPAETAAGVPKVDASHLAGTSQTGRDIGASVLLSSGTGTGQVSLSSGKVAATIAAGDLAANSLTASALASDAVAEIQSGLSTLDAAGIRTAVGLASANLDTQLGDLPTAAENATAVWSAGTRILTAGTNIALAKGTGITGFNDLDAAGVRSAVGLASANLDTQLGDLPTAAENATAIWSAGTRRLTDGTNIALAKGTGVTGFNDLDAAGVRTAVGLASANLDTQLAALPTAGENADAVWDESLTDHDNAGSTGEALAAAGSAGDPWTTALPGSYTSGQAGHIIGTAIPDSIAALPTDADVKTQAASALTDYDPPTRTEATSDKDAILAAIGDVPTAAENADAVLDEALSGHTNAGSLGKAVADILEDTSDTLPGLIAGIDGGGGGSVQIVTAENGILIRPMSTDLTLDRDIDRFRTRRINDGVLEDYTYADLELTLYINGVESELAVTWTALATGYIQPNVADGLPEFDIRDYARIEGYSPGTGFRDDLWYGYVYPGGSGGGTTVIGRYDDEGADSPNVTCKVGELGVAKSVSVADAAGEPVDLTDWGDKQIIIERASGNREDVQVIANASITISGDDNEIFSFTPNSTVLERPGDFRWSLREVSTGDVIIDGRISVSYSPMEDTP